MKAADDMATVPIKATHRDDVVDVMRHACLAGEPRGLLVERSYGAALRIADPRRRGIQLQRAARGRSKIHRRSVGLDVCTDPRLPFVTVPPRVLAMIGADSLKVFLTPLTLISGVGDAPLSRILAVPGADRVPVLLVIRAPLWLHRGLVLVVVRIGARPVGRRQALCVLGVEAAIPPAPALHTLPATNAALGYVPMLAGASGKVAGQAIGPGRRAFNLSSHAGNLLHESGAGKHYRDNPRAVIEVTPIQSDMVAEAA